MGVIIYSFNVSISPKMSVVCLSVILLCYRINAYDFVIKDFVIKRGRYLCQTLNYMLIRKDQRKR